MAVWKMDSAEGGFTRGGFFGGWIRGWRESVLMGKVELIFIFWEKTLGL